MTDLIHEQPEEERSSPPPPASAAEEPLDERTGQKRVYGYIFLLFVVAFCLLLWSFLMNQRSNEQVISELRGNAGTIQSTLDRNVELEQQNEAQEKRIAELEQLLSEAGKENETLNAQLHAQEIGAAQASRAREETDAARSVYYAMVLSDEERYSEAAGELAGWNTAELKECIDGYDANAAHYAGQSGQPETVRSYYDALVEQLTDLGYLSVGEDGRLSLTEPTD